MIIKDFPKLHSPFIRKEINGEYIVTPEIDPDYKWVFEDIGVQAVEKLHGSNVSIIIQNGKLIKAYNRLNEKEIWRVDKTTKWSGALLEGIVWAMRKELLPKQDGQYFGELIGEIMQGNPLSIKGHAWVWFDKLKEKCFWKTWVQNKYPKTYEAISDWFKSGLKSLFAEKYFKENKISEGIVFYHPDGRLAKLRRDMFDWHKGPRHGY